MFAFLAAWSVSAAAMMLPSAAPFVRALAAGGVRAPAVVAGYLAVWSGAGVTAYGAMAVLDSGALGAGGALIVAGAYQVSPLKHACLRRCRTPFHFLLHRRSGFRIGLEYGGTCFACCAGLMLALLVLGMASVVWMVVAAGVIAAEKLLAAGPRLAYLSAAVLLVAGCWAVLA